MSNLLQPFQGVEITVAASDKLATYSASPYSVQSQVGYPNVPPTTNQLFLNSGSNTTSAFTKATTVVIQAGVAPLYYETGTGPVIVERANLQTYQADPGTLNTTGTLTAALILGGVVTSTTASAVTATLDTGAVMEAVLDMNVGDAFFWSAINLGGTNAFTVTAAATGHTVVGQGGVTTVLSGRFMTRKTAFETFVTYRIS
jgi:hypothetical protein